MKGDYNIKATAIDKDGNETEWSNKKIRIKVFSTLECKNGKLKVFEGILKEVV